MKPITRRSGRTTAVVAWAAVTAATAATWLDRAAGDLGGSPASVKPVLLTAVFVVVSGVLITAARRRLLPAARTAGANGANTPAPTIGPAPGRPRPGSRVDARAGDCCSLVRLLRPDAPHRVLVPRSRRRLCQGDRRVRRAQRPAAVTAVLAVAAGVLGLLVGHLVNRSAGRFPWPPRERSRRRRGDTPADVAVSPPQLHDRGGVAVRVPLVELATALLFVLVVLRFGTSWEVPAFLWLAGSAVLLALIDLHHRLLPNRVVLPAVTVGAALLLGAALPAQHWAPLLRAGLGAAVLFLVFLFLALISPEGLGMGDVKLAGLLGLYLGWIGWEALALGAAAGFVVQAVLALALLAGGRIGLRGELPFGPAMLAGAALAIGWSGTFPA